MSGSAEAERMEFMARGAEENAAMAELSAKDIDKRGKDDARIHRRRVKAFAGEQRANYGASGVDVNVGAPADIVEGTYLAGEADALAIRRNAALEAWGMRSQAAGFRSEAGALRVGASNARAAGYMAASATLLTGSANLALQNYQYKNIGKNSKTGGTWKKSTKSPRRVIFGRTRTNVQSSGVF